MTEVLLVRHGETDWNRENRFQGHADPPLNARGWAQAAEVAERLAAEPVDAVYSSPLRRALETAEVVAARLGLAVEQAEGLREIDVGEWQGLTREEVADRYPAAFARWLDLGPGWERGETYDELTTRVLRELRSIAARHAGARVVAVTHGGPLRAVHAAAEDMAYGELRRRRRAIGNCELARVEIDGDAVRAVV